jgi:hypothetical protein
MTLITSIWTSRFAIMAGDKRITTGRFRGQDVKYDDTGEKLIHGEYYCFGFHGENQRFEESPVFPGRLNAFLLENQGESFRFLVLGILNLYRQLSRDRLNFGISALGIQNNQIEAYHIDPQNCRIVSDSYIPTSIASSQNIRFNDHKGCPGAFMYNQRDETKSQLDSFCKRTFWDTYNRRFPNPLPKGEDYFENRSSSEIVSLLQDFYAQVNENEEDYSHMINGGPDIVLIELDNGISLNPHLKDDD